MKVVSLTFLALGIVAGIAIAIFLTQRIQLLIAGFDLIP